MKKLLLLSLLFTSLQADNFKQALEDYEKTGKGTPMIMILKEVRDEKTVNIKRVEEFQATISKRQKDLEASILLKSQQMQDKNTKAQLDIELANAKRNEKMEALINSLILQIPENKIDEVSSRCKKLEKHLFYTQCALGGTAVILVGYIGYKAIR